MASFIHIPVLVDEVIEYLAPRPGGVYCDGTVGGGGHTRAILERAAPDGRVIGIDRDPAALAAAQSDLRDLAARVTLVHGRFGDVAEVLEEHAEHRPVDGIVLDVGTSSPQFDHPGRGFSFLHEGPIDMRMDPTTGESALELMRRVGPDELTTILREYGEERYAARIAERVKDALRNGELATTLQLAELVARAVPAKVQRKMKIHPATRTFQALRIAVNRELDELARFLEVFPGLLQPGGRCVIVCFHSLEDRLVKHRFRELARVSSLPPELARQAGERVTPICTPLTRKPVFASEAEVQRNPRARSARLRACQKVAA